MWCSVCDAPNIPIPVVHTVVLQDAPVKLLLAPPGPVLTVFKMFVGHCKPKRSSAFLQSGICSFTVSHSAGVPSSWLHMRLEWYVKADPERVQMVLIMSVSCHSVNAAVWKEKKT